MLWRRPDGELVRDLPPTKGIVPYLMRGRNESAHQHFERALEIAGTIDDPDLRARVTYDFARALEAEGDAAAAAHRFREAYEAGRGTSAAPLSQVIS